MMIVLWLRYRRHKRTFFQTEDIFRLEAMSEGQCICGSVTKKHCGKCKSKHYCSRECQKNDWINHKNDCKEPTDSPTLAKDSPAPVKDTRNWKDNRKLYVREINEEERKKFSSVLAMCYLKSRDGRRFLHCEKDASGAVPKDSIEWEKKEPRNVLLQKWTSGEPVE